MLEIERKFLLADYPGSLLEDGTLRIKSEHRIQQTYLAMDANEELRVRKIVDLATGETTYTHTFKRGNGIAREEVEYAISENLYAQLIQAVRAIPLTKNRITACWGDTIVEIDRYDQIELTVLEVEFDSEAEAAEFAAPAWFGRDISAEKQYSNKTVWKQLQGLRP